jgi:hypothetical protein
VIVIIRIDHESDLRCAFRTAACKICQFDTGNISHNTGYDIRAAFSLNLFPLRIPCPSPRLMKWDITRLLITLFLGRLVIVIKCIGIAVMGILDDKGIIVDLWFKRGLMS